MERFRNVRRDDYLILRGPVEESSIDARYGVAIIHPLLNDDGRKFETGAKTGTDLTPKMIKSGKLARYVYISFAKADDGKGRDIGGEDRSEHTPPHGGQNVHHSSPHNRQGPENTDKTRFQALQAKRDTDRSSPDVLQMDQRACMI